VKGVKRRMFIEILYSISRATVQNNFVPCIADEGAFGTACSSSSSKSYISESKASLIEQLVR
jgi:hypothetical protein